MSFLHLVSIGDFEREDESCLRLTSTPDDPIRKPIVRQPLDPVVVERLVAECSSSTESGVIPANWSLRLEDGYLVGDRYALSVEEIHFLKRLVAETDCRIFEWCFEVSIDDLVPRSQVDPVGEVAAPASIL